MPKVDAKGRIVLPQDVRDRLGITPGTEIEVLEEDGKIIIEPEDGPEQIIQRMESLIEEASSDRNPESCDEINPEAKNHRDIIRRQAKKAEQSNK